MEPPDTSPPLGDSSRTYSVPRLSESFRDPTPPVRPVDPSREGDSRGETPGEGVLGWKGRSGANSWYSHWGAGGSLRRSLNHSNDRAFPYTETKATPRSSSLYVTGPLPLVLNPSNVVNGSR